MIECYEVRFRESEFLIKKVGYPIHFSLQIAVLFNCLFTIRL
ncbi:hypothetical protein JCM19294_1602 [Nonlabens tegetincola]|uniref:Uncharacterized protein n=1 Tax=Nonlabens tegetincola TaxID=323273 RepID=A0A090Q4V2_9FLAO|nr:hypothetical protein JCM19294_1602 [Nonlabens tegetincola]